MMMYCRADPTVRVGCAVCNQEVARIAVAADPAALAPISADVYQVIQDLLRLLARLFVSARTRDPRKASQWVADAYSSFKRRPPY
jgi:hypothetical protein